MRKDGTTANLPKTPWSLPAEQVCQELGVSASGLDPNEVRQRRQTYGPNRLREHEQRSVWRILWEQVKSLIMLLLVIAALVAIISGQPVEALAIAAVIGLNTAIGFFTEWQAVRSMEALQQLGGLEATVRRAGQEQHIDAEDVVPGDLVVLQAGDLVPADLRLIEVSEVTIDESALTGESALVAKQTEPVAADAALADRVGMAFKGTVVTHGTGIGVVVASGMRTALGEISELVETAEQGLTPLEKKLDRLGYRLVWLTLGIAAAVTGSGVLVGRELSLMIETGIALAVAAVPEGLPIVATVALAHGMWRMLRRHALIRRLSSVETLGATTIICTDKTGTLTENQMTVTTLALPTGTVRVKAGNEKQRPWQIDGEAIDPTAHEGLQQAIEVSVLCNAACLQGDEDLSGDPMEIALLRLGRLADRPRSALLEQMPEVRQQPFARDTKMMATLHKIDNGYLVAVKGAPEAVLDVCTHLLGNDGETTMDDKARRTLQQLSEELAQEGLRVLGLARKVVSDARAEPYHDLRFLGHLGLQDPPRTDVREAIRRCRDAGIRVIMVTGDHAATARYVAQAVGIVAETKENPDVVEGGDITDFDQAGEADRERLRHATILARVTPEQKLDLIDLHQEHGDIVAMTGDGINDAPALRSADIGIAMGQRGTEVAREAADMVLQDDQFATIVAAVEQGRVIFENIRTFVIYLLSGNVGEILAVGTASVTGAPLLLLPLQILYLNLLNDVFPALALGVGRGTPEVMQRPPHNPQESVLTRNHWGLIGGFGVLIALVLLGAFFFALYGLEMTTRQAVTVSFLTLSITRLLHAFNLRSPGTGMINNDITRNPFVWVALALCLALLLLALYVPFLAHILQVTPPGLQGWLLIGSASVIPLIVGQVYLAFSRRTPQDQPNPKGGRHE